MKKLSFLALVVLFAFASPVSAFYGEKGVDQSATGVVYEGSTEDAFETTVSVTDPTADRTITYPDSDQTIGTASSVGANVVDADAWADVVVANAANQACSTTCGIAGAYVGFDAGTNAFVATSSALADSCACDGAIS